MILAFYGASGLGTEFHNLALRVNEENVRWKDMIFVDDAPEKEGQELVGRKIMPFTKAIETYGKENLEFVLSVGEPAVKGILYKKLKENGCTVTNLFHPEVIVRDNVQLGEGIVIQRHSGPPPLCVFGNNVLLQGTTALGHNLVLGDNVVISSFVFVGGDTVIGENTYVGPHSCVRNGLKIGKNAIIGMGSVVTKDVPDNAVVCGNPAKILRYNESSRVFKK